jgi:hypothetical protein
MSVELIKGRAFQITQDVVFLGPPAEKEVKHEGKSFESLLSTATIFLINCRADRIVRGYIINQGVVHTLQTAIPQTCPGDSDAQITACAAQRRWVPLGGDFPAGTPITIDLVSTAPGDDSTIYIQTIIRNETLDAGSLNAVPFVR